jgi:soluble lytic murein transglycosylase-like protein
MLAAAALVILWAAPSSARSQLRMWTDKNGVVHVEDTPPGYSRSPAQATRPRPSRAKAKGAKAPSRRLRFWEKATDAPPDEIDRAAARYNIPADLVRAVIAVESAGDASAISHKGAVGLMQLMPGTAGEMYVEDAVDPAQNISGGTRYLRHLANQFGGDMLLTLAAYNAGPEAVRRFGGVPPFEETRQYVRKVMACYYELKRAGTRSARGKLASANDPRPGERTP